MEPVPETERMEEFRASPLPILRLQAVLDNMVEQDTLRIPKPPTIRRSTDPTPTSPTSPGWSSPILPYRPRNTSPLARGHIRSRSTASALAPQMSRAQSMPGVNAAGHLHMSSPNRPSSPAGSPHRNRTPRKPADEVFPVFASRKSIDLAGIVSAISEDDETFSPIERSSSPTLGLMPGNTFPRSRRPASPLRNFSQYSTGGSLTPTTPTSVTSSPSFSTNRLHDSLASYSYPGSYASSSVPSTPNSVRSRSPSISSLETIPDSPDAEEAAVEAERIAQLKAAADAADAADGDDAEAKRTGSLDVVGTRGRTLSTIYGSRDKRKRWSVCGAERRGDLNLDTIWED